MTHSLQITEVLSATAEALTAVNALLPTLSAHAQPLTLEQLAAIVSSEANHLYLARMGEEAVGMFTLCLTQHPCGTTIWLEDLVLLPRCQGCGLGRQLTILAAGEARRLCPSATLMLTSRPSRRAANKIYSTLFEQKETNVYFCG